MAQLSASRSLSPALLGKSFVHPLFDYLLIGGGLSLLLTLYLLGGDPYILAPAALPYVFLLSNSAHFASSTVRLYTKPGARSALPFLTMIFPLVSLGVLSLCVLEPETLGAFLQSLYLTWSPYHYAAQAYGLAVMYSYRSGCQLGAQDKKLLWWVCMFPFIFTFVSSTNGSGLAWILPSSVLSQEWVGATVRGLKPFLAGLGYALPVLLFVKVWRSASGPMPLISLLMLYTNAIWWLILPPMQAFFWATIFHGIQYLAIVTIFHLKDQMARPDNRHGRTYHTLWFYAASLVLGYGLFNCLPRAYILAGFGVVESMLLVTAAINVHHFIVDGYIWRLKKSDSNRRVVDGPVATPA